LPLPSPIWSTSNHGRDYVFEQLDPDDFLIILQILENYIIRRFVCNFPTSLYNKLFPFLYKWSKENNPSDFVAGVRAELQKRDYPKDNLFRTRLLESKLYGPGERATKTKLILETLESHYNHKEQVNFDGLTIEHILPQTMTDWWKKHLGEDWHTDYELYVHTIGNLTLTGYNSELSNAPFTKKQTYLVENSHIELNSYFENVGKWDREEIENRSNVLTELAVQCWPYFGDEKQALAVTNSEEVTGKTPQTVIILGQRIPVETWSAVLGTTLNTIADLEPELFELLASTYSRFVSREQGRFTRKIELNNGYYADTYLSAKSIYRFCEQAIVTIGLTHDDWIVETF
jgi:hypothetical protein